MQFAESGSALAALAFELAAFASDVDSVQQKLSAPRCCLFLESIVDLLTIVLDLVAPYKTDSGSLVEDH